MSEIQRYDTYGVMENWNNGSYVMYDDHADALRACEARVREQTIVSYDMKRAEQAERNGYVSALDAARDAVAAECIAHHGYTPGQTCPYCTDALWTIAALKGMSE